MLTNRLSNLVVAAVFVISVAFAVQRTLATKAIALDTQVPDTQSTGDATRDYRLEDRYDYMSQAPDKQFMGDGARDYRLEDRYDYMSQVPANPGDRFAGTWTGTMSMTEDPTINAVVVVTIPIGCSANEVCGDVINTANGCRWAMTLTAVNGDVFEYIYSKTLDGDCPALGDGTLTLNSDGTLFREHVFPDFTITGTLTRE